MKATGEQVIQHFQDCCEKYNKLFLPDSPRQESVADAIAKFYESDILMQAIEKFVKSRHGPFIVFDFAVESKKFTDMVLFDSKSDDKFKEILNQTRKRFENEL